MPFYPPSISRCQHLKVNGTQCGSPALRRSQFCFFHKRWHETKIIINSNRARRARFSLALPVLEDAEAIQVSLMQVMRLTLTGQLDQKTAGLMLYALQTASSNLGRLRFEPRKEEVVIDPRTINQTPLGEDAWSVEEYEEEEEPAEAPQIEASAQLDIDAAAADVDSLEDWEKTIAEIEGATVDIVPRMNMPRERRITVVPRVAKRRKSAAHRISRGCKAPNGRAPEERKNSAATAPEGDQTGNQILAKVQAVADNRRTKRQSAIVPVSRRRLTLVAQHVRSERRRSGPERRTRRSEAIN